MFTVRILSEPEGRDRLVTDLHEAGTLGILEEEQHLVAWFDNEEVAARFGTVDIAPDQDWSTAWQQVWLPRLVGKRFYLSPPWMDDPTPSGRIRIDYQPGMACGTGEHPGTRLAMIGLEASAGAGDTVLDVGCGSGILCRAAQLLGARAIGCDIEAPDIGVASEHLAGDYFVGSANAVRTKSVDVVSANIDAEVLVVIAADLQRVARRAIVLSGFRPESIARLTDLYGPAQLLEIEGWSALLVQIVK